MKKLLFIPYFFAGAALWNGVPHVIVALTGRRNLTPFGRDSSPSVNALWGLINLVGGYLLVRYADKKTDRSDAHTWIIGLEAGGLFWTLFGVIYSLSSKRRQLTQQS